ncbi:DUF393 domain-containing protein [Pedobacter sp. N36a]|uniref:thiol-disulfide oxidoreductase DCC family protein n=1 Tax=Pedobacter sp. N36a TaxID=2767996 RepID=UPI0016571DDA|nr:DUF393 domain-containing protein [Pedobacter sp. N36a]MBC8984885.1 DUF393 domain-containing protein [Pedobacter sp. N36a]
MKENREHGMIFFDGVCNLCNHAVQFVIKRDQLDYFRFAALQTDAAKTQLTALNIQEKGGTLSEDQQGSLAPHQEELNTIILLENGKVYYRSTAALRIARKLSGLWPLLYGFIIIPPFIRDFCYQLISKNRYRIWGKQESCMVPSVALKSKFL